MNEYWYKKYYENVEKAKQKGREYDYHHNKLDQDNPRRNEFSFISEKGEVIDCIMINMMFKKPINK